VFVTSKMFHGNLGGIAGADAICQQAAAAAGLGGSWTAWISSSQVDAASRVTGFGPYYLVDGKTLVFNGSPALEPLAPIALDENGHEWSGVSGLYGAWTGSTSEGLRTYYDCADWTVDSFDEGTVGQPETKGETWGGGDPSLDDLDCGTWDSLICFEQ